MSRSSEAVLQEALLLPEEERAEIAGALLHSIEPPESEAVERAWRREVARRVTQYEAGDVEVVAWENVRDELWARLSAGRGR